MLSVAVHKDIAEYQPKIVGKMTMRTLVSITGALSVSVLAGLYIYFVLGLNVSDCTYFIYAVSLPFWCVGFVKPCGMPFEQFAPLWLKANFTNDRIFYKPSMRLAGLLSESENSKQKGTTGTHLNPFDTVSVEHMTRNEQIAFKVDAMLAQAGASAAEAGSNFSEVDQSLVQRCTELAFQKAAERGDNLPPTLQDFYDAANEQPEEQAQVIALRYERFVKGSMNFFNHQSNVDFNTRIVDFNLKDLPDSMLVFALINVCEAVRNRMYFNAKRNVRTWLYVEEMQSMFAYPTVLNYFSRFSNEGRKFGLLLTGISQNATAMLANEAARNIVLNADFLMLLKQSPLDRMKWAELLNLSEQEEECIDESAEPGDGLLIAGNARVPIRGKFPSGNVLYDLFSTNPNETKKTGLGDKKDAKPVI